MTYKAERLAVIKDERATELAELNIRDRELMKELNKIRSRKNHFKGPDRSKMHLPEKKNCKVCHKDLPSEKFWLSKLTVDHLNDTCAACIKMSRKANQRARGNDKIFFAELMKELSRGGGRRLKKIALNLLDLAEQHDQAAVRAIQEVMNRTDGKVTEQIEVKTDKATQQLLSDTKELMAKIRTQVNEMPDEPVLPGEQPVAPVIPRAMN